MARSLSLSDLNPPQRDAALHGLREVLIPASRSNRVAVIPQAPLPLLPSGTPPEMAARAPSTYILEVDAGACWRRLSTEARAPLARRDGDAQEREALLRQLVALELVRPLRRALRQRIAAHATALDAVLDTVAAWRGYRLFDHSALHAEPRYRAEGHVYC